MLEHKELYFLEFRFLPKLFELYEDAKKIFDNFDESKIINKDFMKKNIDNEHIYWDEFKFVKKELPNNVKEFIYDFGVPNSYPLCRYAIFYADDANNIHEFFTLEKTLMFNKYPYLICGQKGERHYNFGLECPDNLEFFEKVIHELIQEKYKPVTGFTFKENE